MEAIKQPIGVVQPLYIALIHADTACLYKILYIRACFRDQAKISCVRKWVSFVISITQRRGGRVKKDALYIF